MKQVQTEYSEKIGSYLVRFPREVSLNTLKLWGSEFKLELQPRSGPAGLLLDTNSHEFESTDCLKWLRDFFTKDSVVRSRINRVAFVQPEQYRMEGVVTNSEAYFLTVGEAYNWLSRKYQPESL